jgi:hypothetical protein
MKLDKQDQINFICAVLGDWSESVIKLAAIHTQWDNPRWAAVCIFRDIRGPGRDQEIRDFASRMGFVV